MKRMTTLVPMATWLRRPRPTLHSCSTVHHLDDGVAVACVLTHGVLFRGAAKGHIRRYLIEDCNYLDAVIGLPANIFYGTGIPTCILVLKKQ